MFSSRARPWVAAGGNRLWSRFGVLVCELVSSGSTQFLSLSSVELPYSVFCWAVICIMYPGVLLKRLRRYGAVFSVCVFWNVTRGTDAEPRVVLCCVVLCCQSLVSNGFLLLWGLCLSLPCPCNAVFRRHRISPTQQTEGVRDRNGRRMWQLLVLSRVVNHSGWQPTPHNAPTEIRTCQRFFVFSLR